VKAAELHVKSIEATRLPTLSVTASDGQSGTTPVHNVNTYEVRGSLNVPVFTAGRIRGEVREAQSELRDATAALDEKRAQIETDVLTALSGVEWALKQVEVSAENIDLSLREVELTRLRFVQGVSDNTEVVNAQSRLSIAHESRIRARYTLGVARANLARAMGSAERVYRR
jgi:outer membrane protein TolC